MFSGMWDVDLQNSGKNGMRFYDKCMGLIQQRPKIILSIELVSVISVISVIA